MAFAGPHRFDLGMGAPLTRANDDGVNGLTDNVRRMDSIPAFVLFHLPHNSTVIPATVRRQFLLGEDELAAELLRMTDHHTLALFAAGVPEHQRVVAQVSRLVVDCERFEDKEPMAAQGMAVVYERTSSGTALRRPIAAVEHQALIDTWYRPHHRRLESVTQRLLDTHGRALLIDAHSFPSKPLLYESDQRLDRPEICIGTDDFHTPPLLATAFVNAFRTGGFDVRVNAPFAGALVPQRHYRVDSRVCAVMVEVNRRLYVDEASGKPNTVFTEVRDRIRGCICEAIKTWESSA